MSCRRVRVTGPDPSGIAGISVLLLRFMRYTGGRSLSYSFGQCRRPVRVVMHTCLHLKCMPHGEAAVYSEEGKWFLPSVSGHGARLLLHSGLSTVLTRYEPRLAGH
jgi:hypothetical protein